MRIAFFCFITAAAAGLGGLGLGIYMGLNEDFTLAPAHAHLNLLGWVTMSLYGLYHRGVISRDARLAWAQVGCGALGFPLMSGGLAVYLATHDPALAALVAGGSFLCLASMALFIAILILDARRFRSARERRNRGLSCERRLRRWCAGSQSPQARMTRCQLMSDQRPNTSAAIKWRTAAGSTIRA